MQTSEHDRPPPVAEQRPHRFTHHGIVVQDEYHWLKDPGYPNVTDPDVLAYLNAENDYFEQRMAPLKPAVDELFEEIKARQPEADESVPFERDGYRYQWRFEAGAQYRRWYRAPVADPHAWTVMLDEVALAADHHYFRLGALAVSPSGRFLAWSADTDGSERFTLRIRDLDTGTDLDDIIQATLGNPVWAADDRTLVYVRVDEHWRPHQALLHERGTAQDADVVIYEEQDGSFFVGVDITQSRAFILVSAGDHVTSEVRYLAADAPHAEPALISPRRPGHEYDVDHRQGRFYIRTNDTHANFRLATAPETDPTPAAWQTVIEGSDDTYLRGVACFKHHIVLVERLAGLDQIRILDASHDAHRIKFPESTYTVGLGTNANYDQPRLRLHYESMITPETTYDYDLANRALISLKVKEIPSGYDPTGYETERLIAPARDGVGIPVSIVHRRGLHGGPLYLYGYGAYGNAIPPGFSASRLSLLDRGFAFAIAHIRGGDDLGYHWYEAGKLANRTNTFNDFVDAARFLIDQGWTNAGQIAIAGGSAGGELMGAVVNQAPELWGAVAMHVPFVDVLNTMLDTSLPLTPIEWPEWGNPIEDKAAFELIRSYSPYDQLQPGAYPPIMVTAGLNDPRVTYWEPAKYVARLRTLKSNDTVLLLKTNMGAGHGGRSGRFEALREVAEEYAFVLSCLAPETLPGD